MTTLEDTFGPIIHRYTRAQALTDGALRDVTATAAEAGFCWPVAVTDSVWADCVAWDPANGGWQDEAGRLWDVVWMAANAARMAKGSSSADILPFRLCRIPNAPGATDRVDETETVPTVELWLHVGPGDDGEPVVTIMFPGDW